jgi:hypothetical protein
LGTAKVLGVVAILVPGFRQLKEWAYAGLVFNLAGALYSHLAVGDGLGVWIGPVIGLTLVVGSYLSYRQLNDVGSTDAYQGAEVAHGAPG